MYLYITPAKLSAVEVPGITLEDGYIPKIGGQILPLKADDGSPLQLEPAVWFKVLVLDSINLDCGKRVVMWNSGVGFDARELEDSFCNSYSSSASSAKSTDSLKRRTSKFRKRISESMYLGGECYGYGSDLDEAFEIAQEAVHDYSRQFIPKLKFYETVLRILHCYILPSIQITPEECPKLVLGLKHQTHMVEKVEKRIMKEHDKAGVIDRAMYRQRLNFVEELSKLINTDTRPHYPPGFIDILKEHIQKDLSHAWDGVNDLQTAVDEAKSRLAENSSAKNELLLKECRAERDRGHQRYEKLLKVREILHGMNNGIHIVQDSKSSKKKSRRKSKNKPAKKIDPLIEIYIGMVSEYDRAIEDIVKITDQKVMVLSVKEAMKQTLDEIDKGEETTGIDTSSTGLRRPTDVLRHSSIPKQWKTVTEQVTGILLDSNHALFRQHEQFCADIIKKCKVAGNTFRESTIIGHINVINDLHCDDHMKAKDDSGCVTEVELSTSNPKTDSFIPKHTELNRESDLLSSTASSAVYVENSIYADMTKYQDINFNKNGSNEDDVTSQRITRKGDSTIYEAYDPLRDVQMPRDSTLASLADDQCATASCFGRLSLIDRQVDNSAYLPDNAAGYQDVASESSPDSGSLLDSVQVVNEDIGSDEADDPMMVFDANKNDNGQVNIDIIKANVRSHFDDMCSALESELHCAAAQPLHRKVWFCYESHFYERTMSHLTEFYETVYANVTGDFCRSLLDLTACDLELDKSFVMHLLKDADPGVQILADNQNSDDQCSETDPDPSPFNPTPGDSEMVELKPMKARSPEKAPQGVYSSSILSLRLEELPPLPGKSDPGATTPESSADGKTENRDSTSSRDSQGLLRRSRAGSREGSAAFDPDAPKPDTTKKRLSWYYDQSTDSKNSVYSESLSADTQSHFLAPIRESSGGDLSGSNSTITSSSSSGSSADSRKGESSSSAENLSSTKPEGADNRASSLSEELALFTDSYAPSSAERGSLTSIKVFVPCTSARSSVCERSTWPLLNDRLSAEETGTLLPRTPLPEKVTLPQPFEKDHLILQDKYKEMLSEAIKCVISIVNETSPLVKLQFLTKSLRELSEVIKLICFELYGNEEEASADKQLDFLVVFLCNCEVETVGKLYVNVNLLSDIIPTFMESGPFAYALVQFTMAISFLKDRILCLSRSALANSSC